MTEPDVREIFLKKLGLRIEPEMAGYVLKQTQPESGSAEPFPVMAADARTGMPVRKMIDPRLVPSPGNPGVGEDEIRRL